MIKAPRLAKTKIHGEISVRYSYFCNHPLRKYKAIGVEIIQDIITRTTKSVDSILHRFATEAPRTLRTPISLVRCSAVKEARPKIPKQLIMIARIEKKDVSLPMRSSLKNLVAYCSSTKLYSNGEPLSYFLNTFSI